VDIAVKTRLTKAMIAEIGRAQTRAAQYLKKYANEDFMWDELAAATWIDPSIFTRQDKLNTEVDFEHVPTYGDTLTWGKATSPASASSL
jgi:purine nucleosidase